MSDSGEPRGEGGSGEHKAKEAMEAEERGEMMLLKRRVIKLQQEGKIATMGRGLKRTDFTKLLFKESAEDQKKRKEQLRKTIENQHNQLRRTLNVLEHLRKKWEVEIMKVKADYEKELLEMERTATQNRDKSIMELKSKEDEIRNAKSLRNGQIHFKQEQIAKGREEITHLSIIIASFYRAARTQLDPSLTSKKLKSNFIAMQEQFVRGKVPDPKDEFFKKESLLMRVYKINCKAATLGNVSSSGMEPRRRSSDKSKYHSSLYFKIVEQSNETSAIMANKVQELTKERNDLKSKLRDVTERYHVLREQMKQRGLLSKTPSRNRRFTFNSLA